MLIPTRLSCVVFDRLKDEDSSKQAPHDDKNTKELADFPDTRHDFKLWDRF